MADPIADIIGDYRAFAAQQRDRLATRGIDITPYQLSHLAYRVPEWDQYVHVRGLIERHAVVNRENVWNGRPISLIVPAEPLEVLDGKSVPLIAQPTTLSLPMTWTEDMLLPVALPPALTSTFDSSFAGNVKTPMPVRGVTVSSASTPESNATR